MTSKPQPKPALGLFDSICVIVGIIIGTGLFETAPLIASSVQNTSWLYFMWILGGLLSLAGALCYAELAIAYPQDGGDFHYLNRAYSKLIGFLFAWSRMIVIRPGSIAAMALTFSTYAQQLWSPLGNTNFQIYEKSIFGCIIVLLLTAVNVTGIKETKQTQNVLTSIKVLVLILMFFVALFYQSPSPHTATEMTFEWSGIGLALILILFCYGGWNEIAYVAAEVRDPDKNILRTLVLGTLGVTVLYIIINIAFLKVVGLDGMRNSKAIGEDVVTGLSPLWGANLMSLFVCIVAMSAINGLILTGARVSYAMGVEHKNFRMLASWNEKFSTPDVALYVQGIITISLIIALGTFERIVVYTTAVVWIFFALTALSVIVLRNRDANRERPYRVLGYPLTPIIFCLSSLYLVYSAIDYDLKGSLISFAITAIGVPLYYWSMRHSQDTSSS